MSSQYYYSQNAHTRMATSNSGFQQPGTVYSTQSSSTGIIPSHQLPNSGQVISHTPTNIHVIPAHHHYQPQIITHQQLIQPQSQSNISSPIYSSATPIQSGQSLIAHPTTRTQSNSSLLSASINGTTRFIENGTTTPQNSIHPQRVQVSPQPIIVSSASNAYSLENGHVTLQQNQPYYTNLPQGATVLHQTHVAYSQPTTTVSQVPAQAHHFHHSVPTQTIQVVHSNTPSNHPVHHNRIIPTNDPRTIYHPQTRGSLHFQREDVKYVPVLTSLKTPITQQTTFSPVLNSPHQIHSYKVEEDKQFVTTLHQPLYVTNQPSNTPLNQPNRLSVYTICRENSSQDTISPLTPLSTEEFESPHQPSFSTTFQRMRLDEKSLEDKSFKPLPSTIKNTEIFAKPNAPEISASKLKMALDSQSGMVEKDESAETMDFNYYPSSSKEAGDDYDQPSTSEGKRSCSECRRVHKRCSKERPCLRCVRLGKKCVDLPEKKRGRPKKIDKVRQMNNTLSSATPSSVVSSVSSNSSPSSLLKISLASIGSQSSVSSFGATPISNTSSISDSIGSSFNSQISSVSSAGNYLRSEQKISEPQSNDLVLPSFSNLMLELDIRDTFSRQNNKL
ncbi:predicted protein [Naegleria gruberi]|uniref:Predicted protein n=1 Tax=Naegleria gruberi TaxID=5762 RepID=D2VX92_NAEGR|nr:uncharacterized protein NAEGRDRAFT_73662 [Naegleria gruberi]EFC38636.1 predicted protein [Naegleria gruberi]|eukprot:XP_002671380.1 predicted protein [Naegleria gruberi strain NEG-M]